MYHTQYKKSILPNGLIIVSEKTLFSRSVSLGVWVKSGSRQEHRFNNGIAHFLEHMLFKGTRRRSAREIARSLESVGGYLNAYTSKEQTCYYADILDTQLSRAVDVLSDMLCNSLFAEREIEKEREVILDEIDSVEDTPDDLVQDIFMEKLYPDHSLGYPIIGTRETVNAINREQLLAFFQQHYHLGNIVIAAAGNVDHERLTDLVSLKFTLPPARAAAGTVVPGVRGHGEYVINRKINQAHICLGTPALPYKHHLKYELLILNTVLGVGMGSRLFQNIREKHGVAYSIYSYVDFFSDEGLLAIYLGTEKKKRDKAIRLVSQEFQRLRSHPLSERELKRVKSQLKGNLFLGLENTSRRMSRLAKMEIYLQEYQDVDKVIKDIDQVSSKSLHSLVSRILEPEQMLQVTFLPN